jgi:hypothetical protein
MKLAFFTVTGRAAWPWRLGKASCGMLAGDAVYMNCNRGQLRMALSSRLQIGICKPKIDVVAWI